MKLRLEARTVVSLAFVILSLGSAVYVSYSGVNFLLFFPSLDQLQLQVSRIVWNQQNASYLIANVAVTNPTSYSGLKIVDVFLGIFFVAGNKTLFKDQPLSRSLAIGKPLAPRGEIDSSLTFQLDSQQSSSLLAFNSTHVGQVIVHNTVETRVSTFLDQVTGSLSLTQEGNVTLS